MQFLKELSSIFLIKFFALNIGFAAFLLCMMFLCKKQYKMIPMFSVMLLIAFETWCFALLKLI